MRTIGSIFEKAQAVAANKARGQARWKIHWRMCKAGRDREAYKRAIATNRALGINPADFYKKAAPPKVRKLVRSQQGTRKHYPLKITLAEKA